MSKHVLFLLLLLASGLCGGADLPPTEEAKIQYLIVSVETLADAQFVRNGVAYDGKAAADHLRMKRQKAGSRVRSADDFIALCASVSSVSGSPYLIRFRDGRTVAAGDYLRKKLAEFHKP